MLIIVFVSCCIVTQAQAQQQQKPLPLQNNDPLNDGIYVQSITLPSSVTTTNDDERSTNESSDINRERLIMYDFKPAFPPYTKESLDKLLIIPTKVDNNVVDVEESPLIEEEMDDDDIDDAIIATDEKINSDEVIDEEVVHHKDDELTLSEEDIKDEVQQQSNSDNESSDEVKVVDDTNIGNDEVIEEDEDISSTDSSDTNGKNNEATETIEIQQQDEESDETKSLSEDVKDDNSNNYTVVEEETYKSDTMKDDDGTDNDINVPPRPVEINEYDDTIYPETTPEEQHQPLTPTSLPEEGDDAEQLDEVPTIEKEEDEVVVDDDLIMSNDDAPEAAEEVIITLKDDSVADEKENDDENESTLLADESIVPENSEHEVKNDDKDGEEDDTDVNTANPNEEEYQSVTDTPEEFTATTTQTNDAAVKDSTYQEELKQEEEAIKHLYDDDTGSILNSNSNNKEANREFVDGLDEIDKLFEEVEVPDELDVGADGSSMQDVLVGQGLKIIWKRAKLVSKGIKSKVDDIATSVKGLYIKLQLNDNEDEEENDLTIDSLLDMNSKLKDGNEAKSQSFKGTDHTKLTDNEEDNEDFPLIKSPQAKKIIKWSKRKLKQVRHILDDLLSIFGEEEDDEDDLGDDFLTSRRQAMGST